MGALQLCVPTRSNDEHPQLWQTDRDPDACPALEEFLHGGHIPLKPVQREALTADVVDWLGTAPSANPR